MEDAAQSRDVVGYGTYIVVPAHRVVSRSDIQIARQKAEVNAASKVCRVVLQT
jgi:hypothetical protein